MEGDDNIDSQDSNTLIDHGHLAWNCSVKIITLAVKASVISSDFLMQERNEIVFTTLYTGCLQVLEILEILELYLFLIKKW